MAKDWISIREEKNDAAMEMPLNSRRRNLLEELKDEENLNKQKEILKELIRIFNTLHSDGFDYNPQEFEYIQRKLEEVEQKIKDEEIEEKSRAKKDDDLSWYEYKEGEQERDQYEEEYPRNDSEDDFER